MEWARRNAAVVVSHDLDFSAMLAANRGGSPSVVQLRLRDTLSSEFLNRLIATLRYFDEVLASGAIVVLDEQGERARVLPLK